MDKWVRMSLKCVVLIIYDHFGKQPALVWRSSLTYGRFWFSRKQIEMVCRMFVREYS